MRRKITFLLTFLVAVLSIIMAGGRVYALIQAMRLKIMLIRISVMLIRIQAMKQ